MEKPYQFYLIHRKTKEIRPFIGYTPAPLTADLCEWVQTSENTKELVQMWDAWEDIRYKAKARLFRYWFNKAMDEVYKVVIEEKDNLYYVKACVDGIWKTYKIIQGINLESYKKAKEYEEKLKTERLNWFLYKNDIIKSPKV